MAESTKMEFMLPYFNKGPCSNNLVATLRIAGGGLTFFLPTSGGVKAFLLVVNRG